MYFFLFPSREFFGKQKRGPAKPSKQGKKKARFENTRCRCIVNVSRLIYDHLDLLKITPSMDKDATLKQYCYRITVLGIHVLNQTSDIDASNKYYCNFKVL